MSQYSLSRTAAFSYGGEKVVPTRDDEVMFIAGNAIAFVNAESGAQQFMPNRGLGGISALASVWTHRCIAYSPRSGCHPT